MTARVASPAIVARGARLALLALAVVDLSACATGVPAAWGAIFTHGAQTAGMSRPPVATPVLTPGPASWVDPMYAPHAHGYDVSYPQCPGVRPPAGAGFAIIGVNNGLPYSTNPCLADEWRAAVGPRAVYINAGYFPNSVGKTTVDCRVRAAMEDGSNTRRGAYAIGCSEAAYALGALSAAGVSGADMIWIDVESTNSWDTVDLDLNRTALQAEIDELVDLGRLVGLYGASEDWPGIVGNWSPTGVTADWVAGQPLAACSAPGFSGHQVWMVQELATWSSGEDSDWAC